MRRRGGAGGRWAVKNEGESASGEEEVEEERVKASFRVRVQKGGDERRAVGERMEGRGRKTG
jgi:hypothetical protein